jgi:hypothetical protein
VIPGRSAFAEAPQRATAGPAKGTDASELWVKLTELPRPVSQKFAFRAKGKDVGDLVFWVLTAGELSRAHAAANRSAKELLDDPEAKVGNLAYEEIYQDQKAIHLMAMVCRQPDDPRFPTFLSAADVRDNLTDDEIAVVLQAYGSFRRESGPIISELTPEEMEAWIQMLSEGASRFPLARLSGEAQTDLVMYLIGKVRTASSTATSSAGSPPDVSSTQTPQEQPQGDSEGPEAPETT